jgi:hypothetical protein
MDRRRTDERARADALSREVELLRGVVAALRDRRRPEPNARVHPRWQMLLVAALVGFALGVAAMIALSR